MKRFLVGIFAVVMALSLVGCSTDPVKKDLEDYYAINQVLDKRYGDKIFNQLEKKMSKAETPEQLIAALEEFKAVLRDMSNDYSKFQPKSDEVKEINEKMQTSIKEVEASLSDLIVGVKEEDQNKIMAVASKLEASTSKLDQAEKAMMSLAKKKGLKWQQK